MYPPVCVTVLVYFIYISLGGYICGIYIIYSWLVHVYFIIHINLCVCVCVFHFKILWRIAGAQATHFFSHVITPINASRHRYEHGTLHTWISHVTSQMWWSNVTPSQAVWGLALLVVSLLYLRHVTHINASLHTHEGVMSHNLTESCHNTLAYVLRNSKYVFLTNSAIVSHTQVTLS